MTGPDVKSQIGAAKKKRVHIEVYIYFVACPSGITFCQGLFWPPREPKITSYFAQNFENHSKKYF